MNVLVFAFGLLFLAIQVFAELAGWMVRAPMQRVAAQMISAHRPQSAR
jgi:hypothetical protein